MSVTIKDVACMAETSTATVSKVLNGSSVISADTKERVLRAVKELSYQPNARARSFACKNTQTLFFLARLNKDVAFENPHLFAILAGVEQALHEKGYKLCLQSVTEKDACESVASLIAQKAADGVIVHASVMSKKLAALLRKEAFAHIVIGQPNFESRLCWVDTNNVLSGELAAKHLLDLGKTEIGFIGGKPEDMISWHRLRGVRRALEERGIEPNSAYLKQGDSTIAEGYRLMRQLLKHQARPQAVVCANNMVALGCMQALHEKRVPVPDEMAVITFDDYPFSRITEPALSVVNIDVFNLGKQAGEWVLEKIRKPKLEIQAFTTLPELVVRGSTAAGGAGGMAIPR